MHLRGLHRKAQAARGRSGPAKSDGRLELSPSALRTAFGTGLAFDNSCVAAFQSIIELTHAAGRESMGRILDLMIAATAVVHRADLLTHKPADFAGLGGVVTVVAV